MKLIGGKACKLQWNLELSSFRKIQKADPRAWFMFDQSAPLTSKITCTETSSTSTHKFGFSSAPSRSTLANEPASVVQSHCAKGAFTSKSITTAPESPHTAMLVQEEHIPITSMSITSIGKAVSHACLESMRRTKEWLSAKLVPWGNFNPSRARHSALHARAMENIPLSLDRLQSMIVIVDLVIMVHYVPNSTILTRKNSGWQRTTKPHFNRRTQIPIATTKTFSGGYRLEPVSIHLYRRTLVQ